MDRRIAANSSFQQVEMYIKRPKGLGVGRLNKMPASLLRNTKLVQITNQSRILVHTYYLRIIHVSP